MERGNAVLLLLALQLVFGLSVRVETRSHDPYTPTTRPEHEESPACPNAEFLGSQLTQARSDLISKQKLIVQLQAQNQKLSQQVAALNSQLQDAREPLLSLDMTRQAHERQLAQYKEMNANQVASLSRLVKQIDRQNEELVQLRHQYKLDHAELKQTQTKLAELSKDAVDVSIQVQTGAVKHAQMVKKYAQEHNQLQHLNATYTDQRLAIQKARRINNETLAAYDKAMEQNTELRTVVFSIQAQLNDTQTKLQQCQTQKESLQNILNPRVTADAFLHNVATQSHPNLNVVIN